MSAFERVECPTRRMSYMLVEVTETRPVTSRAVTARGPLMRGVEAGPQNPGFYVSRCECQPTSVKQHVCLWRLWRLCQDVKDLKDAFYPKTHVFG